MEVIKVKLEGTFMEESVIIKKGAVTECSRCRTTLDIISFGLVSPYDIIYIDETFYWCPCGHKWIVDTKEME